MSAQGGNDNVLTIQEAPSAFVFNKNAYASTKTAAGALVDIALLTSNATQLKYLVAQDPSKNLFHYWTLGFVITSMVVQLAITTLCGIIGTTNINIEANRNKANRMLKVLLGLSVFSVCINVLVATFVTTPAQE